MAISLIAKQRKDFIAYFKTFSCGIVDIGTSIARDVLTKYIPYNELAQRVRHHQVWRMLDPQQKFLVNNAIRNGYRDFDFTLTYTLLRNVCVDLGDSSKPVLRAPTQGWAKYPRRSDTTPSDDLERLRKLKNTYYSHLAKASLTEQEFQAKWQELKDVCGRMKLYLGNDYPGELRKLDFPEEEIDMLREVLYNYNLQRTQHVPVSPVEKGAKKLNIEQLYAPVKIRRDLERTQEDIKPASSKKPAKKRNYVDSPDDIFYKGGKPARYVFMRGDAAYGKSVYCLQLLRHWCEAKDKRRENVNLTGWERGLGEFDFVFLVLFRHVNKNRANLLDMICYDMFGNNGECHNAIEYVLSSKNYRCLIILDGLDEWKAFPQAKESLTHKGIPNVETMSCCTYFVTFRPWKLDQVLELLEPCDRVIEILGLDEKGVDLVIKNVLVNFVGISEHEAEFHDKFQEMKQKSRDEKFRSIMQIPLLLTVSVLLWHRKEVVENSMTSFYMALIKLLIRRTFNTSESYQDEQRKLSMISSDKKTKYHIPDGLKRKSTLLDFSSVLCSLGQIAYSDLASDATALVFDKSELQSEIDPSEIEFALTVGLLSKSESPVDTMGENLVYHFFHKTMQEFLAAVCIVCKFDVSSCPLYSYLSKVNKILEQANMITFSSGLLPSLGSALSKHIAEVVNKDPDICKYRETFDDSANNKVKLLYKLLINCYVEAKHGLDMLKRREILTYVSDVYLSKFLHDKQTVRMSVDVMQKNPSHIVSIRLLQIPNHVEFGITEDELLQILNRTTSLRSLYLNGRCISTISDRLTSVMALYLCWVTLSPKALYELEEVLKHNTELQFLQIEYLTYLNEGIEKPAPLHGVLRCLPNSQCLSSLYISDLANKKDIRTLQQVLPELKCLKTIRYNGNTEQCIEEHSAVAVTLARLKQLQNLRLAWICLGDKTLCLTSEMSQVASIELYNVEMSVEGWNLFLGSLVNIKHQFCVSLWGTNIDDALQAEICSSPCFSVSKNKDEYGWWRLDFTRVILSILLTDQVNQRKDE